jgi:hypothetical protein
MTDIIISLLCAAVPAAFSMGMTWEKHKQDKEIEDLKKRLQECEVKLLAEGEARWKPRPVKPKNLRAC